MVAALEWEFLNRVQFFGLDPVEGQLVEFDGIFPDLKLEMNEKWNPYKFKC